MSWATIGGLRVHYEQEGTGAVPLVFVHGTGNSIQTWWAVRERLDGHRYTATYLDLPGCGASEAPGSWESCTIGAYADVVADLCAQLGLDHPVLVGHSLGGAIGISLAMESPEFLRGLVLVAPASTEGLDYLPESSAQGLLAPTEDGLRSIAGLAFHRPVPPEHFEALVAAVASATPVHFEGVLVSCREFRVADRLGAIATPTLLVAGDRDRHVPLRYALRTASAIPHCGVHIFHNVGHAPFWEVPDDFVALLDEFTGPDLAVVSARGRSGMARKR